MSKIKVLLPEEKIWELMLADLKAIKDEMSSRAEYGVGHDDEGRPEVYIENYCAICDAIALDYVEKYDDQMDDTETKDALGSFKTENTDQSPSRCRRKCHRRNISVRNGKIICHQRIPYL